MDQATGTPLKTGGELGCSERVTISCSKGGSRGVNLVTNPLISESHEWGKNREALTSEKYPWSFMTQILHYGQPNHGDDRKTFEVMISI